MNTEPNKQNSKKSVNHTSSQKFLLNRMKLKLVVFLSGLGFIIGNRSIESYEIGPLLLLVALLIMGSLAEALPKNWAKTSFDGEKNTYIILVNLIKNLLLYGVIFSISFLIGFLVKKSSI